MSGGIPKVGSFAREEDGGGPRGRGGWVGAEADAGADVVEADGSRGLVHVTSPLLAFQKYHADQVSAPSRNGCTSLPFCSGAQTACHGCPSSPFDWSFPFPFSFPFTASGPTLCRWVPFFIGFLFPRLVVFAQRFDGLVNRCRLSRVGKRFLRERRWRW